MKSFLCIVLIIMMTFCCSFVYAGDAWPWVVGGIAGAALLTTMAHQNNAPNQTTVIHHQPVYTTTQPVYTNQVYRPAYVPAMTGTYVYPQARYTTITSETVTVPTYSTPYYGY